MSKTRSKLHGLTWAPSKRWIVTVAYNEQDIGEPSTWTEGWPVAAFTADGYPIVMAEGGLVTVPELLERYERDGSCSDVEWTLQAYEGAIIGVRRLR
jgi:hypothetical protein